MKIIIRTNPEIVLEVEPVEPIDQKIDQPIIVSDPKIEPDVEPKPEQKERGGKGVRHCKKCGEAGHRSDYSPKNGGGTIKEKIRGFADDGLTSEEIADKLGVSLSVVSKYW
jgi:hypothetical protein